MPTLFDRVNAGIARFAAKDDGQREVDVAFVKACNHDPGPPKEKHVRKLLQVTSIESCETQEHLVASIERKLLGSKDCQVVAKCLLIVHRLLKDGSWYFKEIFYKGFAHIFDHLGNFKDDTNRVSWQLSTFIRAYSAFLHHRSVFFTSFAYEHELDRAKTLDVESLISELPVMQNCIDLGLQVVSSKDIVDVSEPTQDYARNLVLADVLALSLHLMKAVPRLVELFFDQPRNECKDMIFIYKESMRLLEELSLTGCNVSVPPSSVLETMESHLLKLK
eukprot:CAMPEP_0197479814 /NCGR_PEP_ID=MMETSP1309-20131121/36552_1 /TAXON_ID=464262 /ORGANISM="Genus nov. species nov., Strain RCC998" /LENGTH=276 /DNA_ID=CAMNT_0043021583 /DNA_START=54 /DNA_END=884 /DNA_ORIENTATION=+